jgi:hypothetical protein
MQNETKMDRLPVAKDAHIIIKRKPDKIPPLGDVSCRREWNPSQNNEVFHGEAGR